MSDAVTDVVGGARIKDGQPAGYLPASAWAP
jgi:hypothetical protein